MREPAEQIQRKVFQAEENLGIFAERKRPVWLECSEAAEGCTRWACDDSVQDFG